MTELMQNVEKLWKMDIMPYQTSKSVMRSKQEKEALELLETKTRHVQIADILRYTTPLLRKRDVPPAQSSQGSYPTQPQKSGETLGLGTPMS